MKTYFSKGSIIKLILFITLILFGVNFLLNIYMDISIRASEYHDINQSKWEALIYDLNDFSPLYSNNLDSLKNLYNDISSPQYYEINKQFLEIPNFVPGEIFLYGYEYGHSDAAIHVENSTKYYKVKTMQISANAFSRFNIRTQDGEVFKDVELYDNEEYIPVVLGSDYNKILKIGDEFYGDYIFKPFHFRVIGILEENANITVSGSTQYLDRYIIMQSFNCLYEPVSSEEEKFQVRHYVNKLGGIYEYNGPLELKEFQSTIDKANTLGLPGEFLYHDLDPLNYSGLVNSGEYITRIILIIIVLVMIFCAIVISLIYFRMQYRYKNLLCINLMEGKPILQKTIFNQVRLFFAILGTSLAINYVICWANNIRFNIIAIFIASISFMILVILNILFLNTNEILKYIGENDDATS